MANGFSGVSENCHLSKGGIAMHHGIYQGCDAPKQAKRILILGESHHDKDEKIGEPAHYKTKSIVEAYLKEEKKERTHCFFHKIACSFGIDTTKAEEKKNFWDKVYFGNYIDVVCGVGDTAAQTTAKAHQDEYNQELREFVLQEKIDVIFCFGVKAVYNYLPAQQGWDQNAIYPDGKIVVGQTLKNGQRKNVYLRAGVYREKGYFQREVAVYGIPHPSAQGGFHPDYFAKELNHFFESEDKTK